MPPTLPTSYEGEWGHVRFTIKVTLDRPWKFDQDTKMAFTVISPVDLNLNPQVKEPFKLELEKSFCCLCCTSGPLAVIVGVPVTGFVSGQIIPVTAECDNASNVRVNSIKLILRKTISSHVHTPRRATKVDKAIIAEISVGPVEAHGSHTWNQQIEIPPLPPSNLVNCSIIDVDYELKVEVDVAGPHRNLTGKIPVVLGTIPLATFQPPAPFTDLPTNQDPSMLPTQPVSPASPPNGTGGALGWNMADSSANNLYPNIRKFLFKEKKKLCVELFNCFNFLAPPTFAESQYKAPVQDKGDDHTRISGNVNYSPRYPTYAFNPSAPPTN